MSPTCQDCGQPSPDGARFCASCGAPLARVIAGRRERKYATALFADVAGSTALAEREDPEVVQALLGRAFERAEQEIERHGGVLEKFIGDAILAVFGVPVAHEDDPERAVRAAIAVQAEIAALGLELETEGRPQVSLRIGIECGELLVDVERVEGPRHRMITGDAVNTAARLEQTAEPGEIVVGVGAHEATQDLIEYVELRARSVKGKEAPVRGWRALRVRPAPRGERVPLQLRARLVGRDEELRDLERALEAVASACRPRLVTVVGPAGIGKSRLTHEFLAGLDRHSERAIVRRGRCTAYGNVSYSALVEVMKAECDVLDDDTPAAVRAKAAATLERLFGDGSLAPHLMALIGGGGDGRHGREDLFDAWRRTLAGMAGTVPLVLVLEDLHWADEGLLDFVEHVVEWGEGPILILALARPGLLERRPAWGGGRLGRLVRLDPLTAGETASMVEDLLAARVPAELATVLEESGDGNPLFCEEIVRMLIDQGVIRPGPGGHWELAESIESLQVPRSIHALLAARLDALEADEKAILQDAAVVGRSFWAGALQRLSGESAKLVGGLLRRLLDRDLIVPREPSTIAGEDEYAFHHVLIRDVAYDGLPKQLRAEKHAATAHWAEEQAGDRSEEIAELLATHHVQALRWLDDLGEIDGRRAESEREGYRWARAAGERARRLWQQREAIGWLRVALDLGARTRRDDLELASLWESYALASDGIATVPDVVDAWEEALARYDRAGSQRDVGRAEASMAHARLWSGNESLNRRVARRAVERLEPFGESADLAFALFVLGRQLIERGEVDEAEPLLRRARAIAGRAGDRRTETNATISLGWTLQARRQGEATLRLFDEALEAARAAGDLSLLLDALEAVLSAAIEVKGDYPRAEALCREAIEIAKRSGNLQKLARTQLNLAYLLGEMGRLDEATEPLEVSLAAATEVGDPTVIGSINGVIAIHRCLQGRLEDAQRAFEARRAVFEGANLGPIAYVEEFDGLILGYLASGRGRDLEAAEALVAANRRVSDARLSVWEGQILLFECVRALVRLGRLEEATVARDRLAGLAMSNIPPRAFLAWADGLLEPDPVRDRDLLAEAAARFEALGRPVDLGRCLLDLAAAEERLGNESDQLVERGSRSPGGLRCDALPA